MDPLTALALTCNVMQLIELVWKVTSTCYEIHKSETGALKENTDIEKQSDDLKELMAKLRQPLPVPNPTVMPTNHSGTLAKPIDNIATDLEEITKDLLKELSRLKVDGDINVFKAIKTGIKATWSKHRIEELLDKLKRCQSSLDTYLLVDLKQQVNLNELQRSVDFERFSQDQKNLIKNLGNDVVTRVQADTAMATDKILSEMSRMNLSADYHESVEQLLKQLHFDGLEHRQEQIDAAHERTFRWVLGLASNNEDSSDDDDDRHFDSFVDWLKTGNDVYWINGKAGSGKSTLMKFLCQQKETAHYLTEWSQGSTHLYKPSFFFWRAGNHNQKSLSGLLRSILYQMTKQSPPAFDILRDLLKPHVGLSSSFSDEVLSLALLGLAQKLDGMVCLFLDGLDEFDGVTAAFERLLNMIFRVTNESQGRWKCCVSSRSSLLLEKRLEHAPKLRLQELTMRDLQSYVRGHIPDHKAVARSILSSASGVFLWVQIVVDSVLRGIANEDSEEELKARVEEMPEELEDLFTHLWTGLDSVYKQKAARIFSNMIYGGGRSISLQTVTLTLDDKFNASIESCPKEMLRQEIVGRVASLKNRLQAICTGLVELVEPQDGLHARDQPIAELSSGWPVPHPFDRTCRLSFIHRDVFDWLNHTDLGRSIVDITSESHLDVLVRQVRSYIAQARICLIIGGDESCWDLTSVTRAMWRVNSIRKEANYGVLRDLLDEIRHFTDRHDKAVFVDFIVRRISKFSTLNIEPSTSFWSRLMKLTTTPSPLLVKYIEEEACKDGRLTQVQLDYLLLLAIPIRGEERHGLRDLGDHEPTGLSHGLIGANRARFLSKLLERGADPCSKSAFIPDTTPQGQSCWEILVRRLEPVGLLDRQISDLPWHEFTETCRNFLKSGADANEPISVIESTGDVTFNLVMSPLSLVRVASAKNHQATCLELLLLEHGGRESIEIARLEIRPLLGWRTFVLLDAVLGEKLLSSLQEVWKVRCPESYPYPEDPEDASGCGAKLPAALSSDVAAILQAHGPVYAAANSPSHAGKLIPFSELEFA